MRAGFRSNLIAAQPIMDPHPAGIWLFAPDSWFSGKSAAAVALFAIPVELVLYWLIKSLARLSDHHNSD
jgi:hypothetical protein